MVLRRRETIRRLLLALSLVAAGAAGALIAVYLAGPGGEAGPPGGGVISRGEWRGMMREMMGGVLPAGIAPEELPDPRSEGARTLLRYCTQCHGLPSPAAHTAREWPAVVERMLARVGRMSRMGGMGRMGRGMMGDLESPGAGERRALVSYLEENALEPADRAALPEAGSPEAALFQDACSRCHELPDPGLHTAAEWPDVVDRMRARMREWGRRVITEEEREAIVAYLRRHAARVSPPR